MFGYSISCLSDVFLPQNTNDRSVKIQGSVQSQNPPWIGPISFSESLHAEPRRGLAPTRNKRVLAFRGWACVTLVRGNLGRAGLSQRGSRPRAWKVSDSFAPFGGGWRPVGEFRRKAFLLNARDSHYRDSFLTLHLTAVRVPLF